MPIIWRVTQKTASVYLFVQEVEGQLKANSLHVRLLEGAGDVHVHVQEPFHGPTLLRLLNLQLWQKLHKPFKTLLVTVDPEKVNLN